MAERGAAPAGRLASHRREVVVVFLDLYQIPECVTHKVIHESGAI